MSTRQLFPLTPHQIAHILNTQQWKSLLAFDWFRRSFSGMKYCFLSPENRYPSPPPQTLLYGPLTYTLDALHLFSQLPEQDMAWLKSWANAVVHASKTDHSERLDARAVSPRATKAHDGDDAPQGGEGFEGESLERGIQARRRAMKVAVREQYAFSATAQLWAEEMKMGEDQRTRKG